MPRGSSTEPGPYCELHAHSCFSLLDAVSFPEALAERAAALGLPAIALTDHNGIYGAVPFFSRAEELGIQPILGVEVTLDDASHLTLLAENAQGYANLCQLISIAQARAPKGQASLPWTALDEHNRGIICLTGCAEGPVTRPARARDRRATWTALERLVGVFGREQVYVELQRHLRQGDIFLSRRLALLARDFGLPYVATGNIHYLTPDDADLQDVLVSIRTRIPLPEMKLGEHLRPNRQYFLRSAAEMVALYPDLPEAVTRTNEVAARCQVRLPNGLQMLPTYPLPEGMSADEYLRQLCLERLPHVYERNRDAAHALLEKELGIIRSLGLANYFLIVFDVVNYCREHNILCHGRGSAANSIVAYLLGISAVDPLAQNLVVERFISVERGANADIDLDIDSRYRDQVIKYVYTRWGRDHAAMACTYFTFRSKSAFRDAGFALGFPQETIAVIAEAKEDEGHAEEADEPVSIETFLQQNAGLSSAAWQRLVTFVERLRRRPRHLGLHPGGMILTGLPIASVIPIEPTAKADNCVVQWDKKFLEALGIVKIDLLGLRMLSAIADTLRSIEDLYGRKIDLHRLPLTDKRVYDRICSARTIGIFQVESGAQVSIIPYLQPRQYQDLVAEVSLIRPGPLQGNMVRPFVRRRQGKEPVTYLHPSMKSALEETYGVIVFQEQVIKIAQDVATFTPGRGELLRRALGGKDAEFELEQFKEAFINGAYGNGVDLKTAESVWAMIKGFAGYSFSKAHAAAFAIIVYWSAWLRVHYPTEYFCGLLSNVPLGTYPARVLESEARREGIRFLPFDINRSAARPSVEDCAIRFGLGYVRGIGEKRAAAIVEARGEQLFTSLVDVIRRTRLHRRALESLILAGALDSFGERRQLLWDLTQALEDAQKPAALPLVIEDERAQMRPMTGEERVLATFGETGVTTGPHLADFRRQEFRQAGCWPLAQIRKTRLGASVRVGGVVADGVRRPPTAKGTAFIRLENADGMVDVIIPAAVYSRCRKQLRSAFIVVDGKVQQQGATTSIVARQVRSL